MATPWSVPRISEGRTVAIFASGPSLTAEDCRKCHDAGAYCIAVNDSFRLAPFADMLYACDSKWWIYHRETALKFAGLKVCLDDSTPYRDVLVLKWQKKVPSGITLGYSDDPEYLATGGNSGYQAVNLAGLMGAKRIILLGFDMQPVKGKTHFFGDHPPQLVTETSTYRDQFIPAFRTIAPELAKRGIEVLNCTEGSALDAFPMAQLNDVL